MSETAQVVRGWRPGFDPQEKKALEDIINSCTAVKKQESPLEVHLKGCLDRHFNSYIRDLENRLTGGSTEHPKKTTKDGTDPSTPELPEKKASRKRTKKGDAAIVPPDEPPVPPGGSTLPPPLVAPPDDEIAVKGQGKGDEGG